MSGSQVFAVLIFAIVAYVASSIFGSYLKYKNEVGRIKAQQELNVLIDKRLSKLVDIEEESVKAMQTMSKRIMELQDEVERQNKIINRELMKHNAQ